MPLLQVQMEAISLQSEAEFDARARERLATLRQEGTRLEDTQAELTARWEGEKARLDGVRSIKEAIERCNVDIEQVGGCCMLYHPAPTHCYLM